VPLSLRLYAEDTDEPVIRYEARNFEVGPVPDERFQFEPPPGATVEQMEEHGNGEARSSEGRENREPQKVTSIAEAEAAVGFPVRQLATPPGDRELAEIQVTGSDGVVQTYGEGWGTVVFAQRPDRESESADQSQEDSRREANSEVDGRNEQLQVPTVDFGGVEAKEISTPIGASLSWSADGVSYSLVGSVTAAELEEAARGLLRQGP
jgi:hypothetical protein